MATLCPLSSRRKPSGGDALRLSGLAEPNLMNAEGLPASAFRAATT